MRYGGTIVCLALVIVLVFAAIQFKKSPAYYSLQQRSENLLERVKHFIRVKKHNISTEFAAQERMKPLDAVHKETKLRSFLPDVFGEFTREDWKEFWALLYEPIEEEQGSLKVKRFRSKEEIEDELMYNYSTPFSYFQKRQWDYFWSIIFPGPRYKEVKDNEEGY